MEHVPPEVAPPDANENGRGAIAMAALEVMSEAFNVSLERLTAATRAPATVAFPRQMAMYLCHVVGRMTVREVATEFGREPSTVSHACHAIEDRRDIEVFDRQLDLLEEAMLDRLEQVRDRLVQVPQAAGCSLRDAPSLETKAVRLGAPRRRAG